MKLIALSPLTVTVELDLRDGIAVTHALAECSAEGCDMNLNQALSAAMLSACYAAWLLATEDPPHTPATMWQRWAPLQTDRREPEPLVYAMGLPEVNDRHLRRVQER